MNDEEKNNSWMSFLLWILLVNIWTELIIKTAMPEEITEIYFIILISTTSFLALVFRKVVLIFLDFVEHLRKIRKKDPAYYTLRQKKQILLGILYGLSTEQIATYADNKLSWKAMKEQRLKLLDEPDNNEEEP